MLCVGPQVRCDERVDQAAENIAVAQNAADIEPKHSPDQRRILLFRTFEYYFSALHEQPERGEGRLCLPGYCAASRIEAIRP